LYHEILNSLGKGEARFLVDDYLSSLKGIQRIPAKCTSDASYFVVRGHDRSPSTAFLVTARKTFSVASSSGEDRQVNNETYSRLLAANIASATLALKTVSEDRPPPTDVFLVILGDEAEKRKYQRYTVEPVEEASAGDHGNTIFGTHLVVVESTGLRACSVQKGCIVFKLCIKGKLHHPAFPWLGQNPWNALMRFGENLNGIMRPKHSIYPVEVGEAPPLILSRFLLGYPTMTPTHIKATEPAIIGESIPVEIEYYASTPPEFSHTDFKDRLSSVVVEVAKGSGCEASIEDVFEEEPFREDSHSPIVAALSQAFLKSTGFEPIFEWLPFPISARELKSTGFAKDVVAFGPGDLTLTNGQNELGIVGEAFRASRILARIPCEVAALEDRQESGGR